MSRSQNNPGLCVDHCWLDVLIIDEEMGLPREVYLRAVVDNWTRTIVGIQTVLTPPGLNAKGRCIERMFRELK